MNLLELYFIQSGGFGKCGKFVKIRRLCVECIVKLCLKEMRIKN